MPKPGELYLHFKQKLYQIITVAQHSETRELMVVYQALYGDYRTFVRPLEMFVSKVDQEKYPDVTQYYRFQRVTREEVMDRGLMGQPANEVEASTSEKPVSSQPTSAKPESVQRVDAAAKEDITPFAPQRTNVSTESTPASASENKVADKWAQFKTSPSTAAKEEEEANPLLMKFLDADTYDDKYKVLVEMRSEMSDRLVNDLAVVLDVVIPEGSLDERYAQLKTCVETFRKFEISRLR